MTPEVRPKFKPVMVPFLIITCLDITFLTQATDQRFDTVANAIPKNSTC